MKAGMAPDLIVKGGYKVRLTAVDAATGAIVSGVVISGVAIQATNLGQPIEDLTPAPLLVPNTSLA